MMQLSDFIKHEFKSQINYREALHKDLVLRLQDPSLALRIYESFQTHIIPLLQVDEKEIFRKALTISSILPGSKKAFVKTLQSFNFEAKAWTKKNKEAFKAFVRDCLPPIFPTPKSTLFKVCLLTTSASGGNHSVAKAVAQFFNSQQNCHAEIIDVEAFAIHDPLKQAIGVTYDGIYEKFFQKQGCGYDVLKQRDTLTEELANHFEPRTLEALKEKIVQLAPNLLITTRNYKEDDLSLASSLNIPMRMLYCDYDICTFHHHLIGKTDPGLIKFWFPSLQPDCFQSLFTHYKAEELYDPNDSWEGTAQKIATMTHTPVEEIKASFVEVGFPVNEEFTPSSNLLELRKKWGFEEGEKVVMVSMGKNGVSEIENVLLQLAKCPKHTVPIRYVFICGTNEFLKNSLEKQLQTENRLETALERAAIYGYISLKEMAELMNVSELSIGKPGGASASEHRALGRAMFVMFSHQFWESGNERQMQKEGLIERYDPNTPLHLQIEACLVKEPPQKPALIDWKTRIISHLQ